MTTLVIGARGSVGRHVVEQLVAAGDSVRASVRRLGSADMPAGVGVVEADLRKAGTLRAALRGVRRVFLYVPVEGTHGFVEAALDADLERVVVMSSGSVLLPSAAGNAIAEQHRAVEAALLASGLPWMPIRPLVLANDALGWGSPRTRPGSGTSDPATVEAILQFIRTAATGRSLATDAGQRLLGRRLASFAEWTDDHRRLRHTRVKVVQQRHRSTTHRTPPKR
jgi:uncharacterized protein YbjT (DUF2867 family)